MSSGTRTSSFRTARMGSQSSHATASGTAASLSTSLHHHHHPQPPHTTSKTSSQTPPLSLSFYNNSNNSVIHGNDATKKKKNVLNPTAVRERSKSIPGCKEIGVVDNTTLIFLVAVASKPSSDTKQNQQPARITIFCDSGTIGTARVLDGTVRQTFRRNVNSLDVVERLLTFPEGPVEINENLIGIHDEENNSNENKSPSTMKINYQKEVELADVGLCILEGEREKLTKHLRQLDEMKEEEEEKQQQQLSKNHKKQQAQLQQQQQQAPSSVASRRLQSQLLEQATNKITGSPSKSVSNDSNNNSNSNSDRTGRRRNKLLNLSSRQKRNTNNASDYNSNSKSVSAVVISKTNDPRTTITTIPSTPPTKKKSNKSKHTSADTTKKLEENVLSAYASALITITKPNNDGIDEDNGDDNASTSSSSSTGSHHRKRSSGDVNKVAAYEFHFKLPADVMKQVDQCLRDIAKMNKVVKGVATNGRGTVFLYGNGGVAYTPSIPKALYHKLRQLRSSSYSSRPCFVALGTRDRYYVAFNDGTAAWKGSNVLDKLLKKIILKNNNNNSANEKKKSDDASKSNNSALSSMLPRSVGFGSTYDTFFTIFYDGSWQYQGRGIPKSLEKKLVERKNRADLLYCNLGPNGEWFLKAENGKMWWSGITQELDLVLKKIMSTGFLHNMDFGENGSYFISYDEE